MATKMEAEWSQYNQENWFSTSIYLLNLFTSPKHVTNKFKITTMEKEMATQWSQSNQSMPIQNYTLLMNFSQTGPPVFPETCFMSLQQLYPNLKAIHKKIGNSADRSCIMQHFHKSCCDLEN